MKWLATISAAALALGASAPAFAQHIAPPSTSFTAAGAATLNSNNCVLTLSANSNAAGTGGTVTGGTNTGPGICPLITIDNGATYTINTYNSSGNGSATATLTGLVVRVGGAVFCTQTTPLGFTITNDGSGGASLALSGTIAACSVSANLATSTVHVTS